MKDPKYEVGDHVRIWKYKKKLQKSTLQVGLKKFLLLKKLNILCSGHMLLVTLTVKKLLERFTNKNYKKTN